jgi:hypothetical protein
MLPARLPRRAACRTGKAENRLWRGLSKAGPPAHSIPIRNLGNLFEPSRPSVSCASARGSIAAGSAEPRLIPAGRLERLRHDLAHRKFRDCRSSETRLSSASGWSLLDLRPCRAFIRMLKTPRNDLAADERRLKTSSLSAFICGPFAFFGSLLERRDECRRAQGASMPLSAPLNSPANASRPRPP